MDSACVPFLNFPPKLFQDRPSLSGLPERVERSRPPGLRRREEEEHRRRNFPDLDRNVFSAEGHRIPAGGQLLCNKGNLGSS